MAQKLIPLAVCGVKQEACILYFTKQLGRMFTIIQYTHMHYKTNNHSNPNCPVKLGPREKNNSKSIFGYLWSNTFKQLNNNWSGLVVCVVYAVSGSVSLSSPPGCVYANEGIRKSLDEWTTPIAQWTMNMNRRL